MSTSGAKQPTVNATSDHPKVPIGYKPSILAPFPNTLRVGRAMYAAFQPLVSGVHYIPYARDLIAYYTPDSEEFRGKYDLSLIKSELNKYPLPHAPLVASNDHKYAAQRRTSAYRYISLIASSLGLTLFSVSKSKRDVRCGLAGTRLHYDNKDEVSFSKTSWDKVGAENLIQFVDVDFHVSARQMARMLSTKCPVMLYTFALPAPAGMSDEVSYMFDSTTREWKFRNPRGEYVHPLWDWQGETVVTETVDIATPTVNSTLVAVALVVPNVLIVRTITNRLIQCGTYVSHFVRPLVGRLWLSVVRASVKASMLSSGVIRFALRRAPPEIKVALLENTVFSGELPTLPTLPSIPRVPDLVTVEYHGSSAIIQAVRGVVNMLPKPGFEVRPGFEPTIRPPVSEFRTPVGPATIVNAAGRGVLSFFRSPKAALRCVGGFLWEHKWLTLAVAGVAVLSCIHLRTTVHGVQRSDIGEGRTIVTLVPGRRHGTLSSVLNHERLAKNALRRFEPSVVYTGGLTLHSLELKGTSEPEMVVCMEGTAHSVPVGHGVLAGLRAQNGLGKNTLTSAGAQVIAAGGPDGLKLTSGDAAILLLGGMGMLHPTPVSDAPHAPDTYFKPYVIQPRFPDSLDATSKSWAWANSPVGNVYAATNVTENIEAAIYGRVDSARQQPVAPDQTMLDHMQEFVKLLMTQTGTERRKLRLADLETILDAAKSEAARQSLQALADEGRMFPEDDWTNLVKSFIKNECYTDPKWPRLITIFEHAKLGNARVAYPLAEVIKKCDWYAFGKSPEDVANRVAFIASKAKQWLLETDFTNYDGTVGYILRLLERFICLELFDERDHELVIEYMDDAYNNNVISSTARIIYAQFFARGSGDHGTANWNSLDAAFAQYSALRRSISPITGRKRSPQEAWDDMGIVGGDDGLLADVEPEVYTDVCNQLLLVVKVKVVKVGGTPTMLARYYSPAVWQGDNTSCCDIKRALAHFPVTTMVRESSPRDVALSKALSVLATDAETPYIGEWAWKTLTTILAESINTAPPQKNVRDLFFKSKPKADDVVSAIQRLREANPQQPDEPLTPYLVRLVTNLRGLSLDLSYNALWTLVTGKGYPNAFGEWMNALAIEQLGLPTGTWSAWLDAGHYTSPPPIVPEVAPTLKALTSVDGVLHTVEGEGLDKLCVAGEIQVTKSKHGPDAYDHKELLTKAPTVAPAMPVDTPAQALAAAAAHVEAHSKLVVLPSAESAGKQPQEEAKPQGQAQAAAEPASGADGGPGAQTGGPRRPPGAPKFTKAEHQAWLDAMTPEERAAHKAKTWRTPEEQRLWVQQNYTAEERAAYAAAHPKRMTNEEHAAYVASVSPEERKRRSIAAEARRAARAAADKDAAASGSGRGAAKPARGAGRGSGRGRGK